MVKSMNRAVLGILILLASIVGVITATPVLADGTTSITITKYDSDGVTVLGQTTIDYTTMESMPVQGDGVTHYMLQGPTFDLNNLWDPSETVNIKDYGACKGTDLKDLCNLVGGMSPGDTVKISAIDGWNYTFDYPNVYTPQPRQGKMVICWWNDGQYVPTWVDGLRLFFFAQTKNSLGQYVFGNQDEHDCFPSNRWYYFDNQYPTTTGLSGYTLSQINIYKAANVTVLSPNGGETAYVGEPLNITWNPSTVTSNVNIYISRNSGTSWTAITPSGGVPASDSSYSWTVTGPASTQARVKIARADAPAIFDTSDADFNISAGTITVYSPNGGEIAYVGESLYINWTSDHVAGNVNIYISRNSGTSWTAITPSGGVDNTGTYSWTVTGPASGTARIKVASVTTTTVFGASANDFNISAGTITVYSPNGGEIAYIGESLYINWTSDHVPSDAMVNIYVSRNSGKSWLAITPRGGVPNSGTYSWTVTGLPSATARIKVASVTTTTVFGASANDFNISAGTITVYSPNGGEIAYIGESLYINWTSDHVPSDAMVNIYVSRNSGKSWLAITPRGGVPNSGTYSWTVTGLPSATARIKVASVTTTTVFGASANDFNISAGTITVYSPNGGEIAYIGEPLYINWISDHVPSNVNIYISRNDGRSWIAITPRGGVPNSGTYSWTPTIPTTILAKVKIARVDISTVFGASANDFNISAGTITVYSPNGGEIAYIGEPLYINWSSDHVPSNVNIYISRNDGRSWIAITPRGGIPNSGTYSWTATTPTSTQAKVKIARADITTVFDASDTDFTISGGNITVTYPNGGETASVGQLLYITWISDHLAGNVNIYISRNSGRSWLAITPRGGVPALDGTYSWTVTGPATGTARIKVASVTTTTVFGTSGADFTIQ